MTARETGWPVRLRSLRATLLAGAVAACGTGASAASAASAAASAPAAKPPFALNDARLVELACGKRACALEYVGTVRAARAGAGAAATATADGAQVSVVRWPLCQAADGDTVVDAMRETQDAGGCAIGYFRVVHRGPSVIDAGLVAVDTHGGPTGYGAGGGDETLEFDPRAGTLLHEVEGGSSWRWGDVHEWRLAPGLELLRYESSQSWRNNLAWSRTEAWNAKEDVLSGTAAYNACTFDPSDKRWETMQDGDDITATSTAYADAPTIGDKAFDWRRGVLPAWLEVRADAAVGPRRVADVLTKTRAPGSALAMRLAWTGDRSLLIELSGIEPAARPRVELWWWEKPEDGSSACVLPAPEFKRHPVRPKNDDAAASDGPVHVAEAVMQMLVGTDGVATPAYGNPPADRLHVERAELAGRVRLLVTWASGPDQGKGREPSTWPYAVALSSTVGGKQHLVSHTPLRFADPTSFALPMRRDPRSPDVDTETWREALKVRFAAPAKN